MRISHNYTSSEKTMVPHSSTLAWKIPWMEEPGGLQSMGHEELDTPERLHFHFSISCIGERNGNPLQCPCLENPRDGRAWWAAVCGVTQIRTQLKWLSIEYTSSLLGLLLPISPSHPPRSSQSARLGSLCYLFMTILYPPCLTQCLTHDMPPNIFFK